MRFNFGQLPTQSLDPDSAWLPMKEPSPGRFSVYAMIASVALAALFWSMWNSLESGMADALVSWKFAIVFALVVVVHELIHLVAHPHFGLSNDSIVGFWPKYCVFYAQYMGIMHRQRYAAVLMAPFLLLSVVPLLVHTLGFPVGRYVALFAFVNAFSAAGDIIGAWLLLSRVPREALVIHSGWQTLWRPLSNELRPHGRPPGNPERGGA